MMHRSKKSLNLLVLFFIFLSACMRAPTTIPSIENQNGGAIPTQFISNGPTVTETQRILPSETSVKLSEPLPTFLTPTSAPTLAPTPSPLPPVCSETHDAPESIKLENYGNFHSMGVNVSLDTDEQIGNDVQALLEYRSGASPYRRGFPLTRITSNQFIGSIFWIEPDTEYDVRVTFVDPASPLHCATVNEKGKTRAEPIIPIPTITYIASPIGDGQACSETQPCSVKTALSKVQAGEAVYLRGGVYYEGNLRLVNSGEENRPILIQGYPGEQAIIDGAQPGPLEWTLAEPGIYATRVVDQKTNTVFAGDERLYPYKNIQDLKNLRWGLPGYAIQGNEILVHLKDGASPEKMEISVARYPYALWIDGDHIALLDITFRHYSEDRYQQGAVHVAGSNNLLQGNTFIQTHNGIAIQPGSHQNVIQHNNFADAMFDWPWDGVYDDTRLTTNGGIRFISNQDDDLMARGNVIRWNTFHDLFDGFHVCPGQTRADHTNETDVYENVVYRATDDGIETDGYCSNVRIWKNQFHHVLMGISLSPARVGPTYVIRNLIYEFGVNKYPPYGQKPPGGGAAIKLATDEASGFMYLFHNTGDSHIGSPALRAGGEIQWSLLVSKNNIWIGRGREAIKYVITEQPMDLDYDLLLSIDGHTLIVWNDIKYMLKAFSANTGLEQHALTDLDPAFVDLINGNYSLSPASPLIDRGIYIPGINDDYDGQGPDIGAYEFLK